MNNSKIPWYLLGFYTIWEKVRTPPLKKTSKNKNQKNKNLRNQRTSHYQYLI